MKKKMTAPAPAMPIHTSGFSRRDFLASAAPSGAETSLIRVGAPASALRGLLFALAFLDALAVGRVRSLALALASAAAAMLAVRPSFLFDAGFQLSFLATAGILYGVPLLEYGRARLYCPGGKCIVRARGTLRGRETVEAAGGGFPIRSSWMLARGGEVRRMA